jgi:hypothetical protein
MTTEMYSHRMLLALLALASAGCASVPYRYGAADQ